MSSTMVVVCREDESVAVISRVELGASLVVLESTVIENEVLVSNND